MQKLEQYMQRMHSITDQEAGPNVEPIFSMIKKKFGRVVNMFRCMANSPTAVQAFSSLSECCEKSSLSAELRHQISLLASEVNGCSYCVAAHSQIAKSMHHSDEMIMQARKGVASEPKSQAS